MQDNEFEDQIRQKLKGLNIDAAETVWEKVDERLHQKEKRRRWLIWIPLGLTGILMCGIVLFRYQSNDAAENILASKRNEINNKVGPTDTISQTVPPVNPNSQTNANAPGTLTDKPGPATPDTGTEINKRGENADVNSSFPPANAELADKANSSNLPQSNSPEITKRKNQIKSDVLNSDRTSVRSSKTSANSPQNSDGKKIRESKQTEGLSNDRNQERIAGEKVRSTIIAKKEDNEVGAIESNLSTLPRVSPGAEIPNELSNKTEPIYREITPSIPGSANAWNKQINVLPKIYSAPASMIVISTPKNFSWGVEVSVGRSGIASGKFDQLFYSPAAAVMDYSAINLSNGNQNNGATGGFRTASQVRPGIAAGLGIFVRKMCDDPLYIRAGLKYEVFTTSILVGTKMDHNLRLQSSTNQAEKSVASYYTSDRTTKFSNRYNFLELPVSFGIKFAQRTRLPFAWELGVAPGLLLASNALNFNQSSAIYYKDNSLLRKMQWQLFTALPVRLFNGKAYSLELAPGFSYNSSSLFRPEFDANKHLLSANVSLRAGF